MRFVLRSFAAAALAASLCGAASAAPSTTDLADLRSFMTTVRDAIPPTAPQNDLAQRAALTKGLAAFGAKSSSVDGDVRIFGKAASAIQGAGIADADVHLQFALDALVNEAKPGRDALAGRIDRLVSSKLLTAARQKLAAADAALASAAAGAGTFSARAKDLRSALATISSATVRVAKATAPRGSAVRPGAGYFACLVDGAEYVPNFGSGRVALDVGQPSEVTLTGYFASARKGGIEIQWSTGTFTGPGTYALDGTSGAFIVMSDRGQTFYSDGSGGQVTVTDYDPVNKRIAGTFEASLVDDSALGGTRTITKGTFDVRRYGTSGK